MQRYRRKGKVEQGRVVPGKVAGLEMVLVKGRGSLVMVREVEGKEKKKGEKRGTVQVAAAMEMRAAATAMGATAMEMGRAATEMEMVETEREMGEEEREMGTVAMEMGVEEMETGEVGTEMGEAGMAVVVVVVRNTLQVYGTK